jgi:hypothetical protein
LQVIRPLLGYEPSEVEGIIIAERLPVAFLKNRTLAVCVIMPSSKGSLPVALSDPHNKTATTKRMAKTIFVFFDITSPSINRVTAARQFSFA